MIDIPVSKQRWKPLHELLNDVSNLEGVEEILFLEECSLYESNVFVITKPQANKDQLRQKLAQTITHLKTKYPWASLSPMILEKNSIAHKTFITKSARAT
jgi:hypothetical protein